MSGICECEALSCSNVNLEVEIVLIIMNKQTNKQTLTETPEQMGRVKPWWRSVVLVRSEDSWSWFGCG